MKTNTLLGEMFMERKLISSAQVKAALDDQKISKEPLGQIFIRLGFVSEADLRLVLSEQLGVSFLAPDQLKPRTNQRLKESIPSEFARQHIILPLSIDGRTLKLAVAKVPDIIFLDNLRKMTGFDILTMLSTASELKRAIEQFYGSTDIQEVLSSSEVDDYPEPKSWA